MLIQMEHVMHQLKPFLPVQGFRPDAQPAEVVQQVVLHMLEPRLGLPHAVCLNAERQVLCLRQTVISLFQLGLQHLTVFAPDGIKAVFLVRDPDALFKSQLGWRATYGILGGAICLVLWLAALLLKKPQAGTELPQARKKKSTVAEDFAAQDFTSRQMLCRGSFWMAFVCISFLAAVGSSVISFAKDLALSVKAPEALAVSLVGVLSVCNGLGRILTGALFDTIGRRKTMVLANLLTMGAAGVTLLAVSLGSLPLCIAGLCLTGMSYGACPTITAAFTSSFFGMKHFSTNMAFMTFTVMGGSLIATLSNKVLELTGTYNATFAMLLLLTGVALILNLFIRKP